MKRATVHPRAVKAVVEHVEQIRSLQMQQLVSQAELRALQAQINPHFLFNSLNTLYGTITRSNEEARRLVLNLADVFRYFLQTDHPLISVEEELKIVRAYLEIEELRLGPKLRSELEIDAEALTATIPVLSIQPLVENAIKHGVASKAGEGFVRLSIGCEFDRVAVRKIGLGVSRGDDVAEPRRGQAASLATIATTSEHGEGRDVVREVRLPHSLGPLDARPA